MTERPAVRVVLVDDHHMFRTGVRAELSGLAGGAASGGGGDPMGQPSRPGGFGSRPALEIVGEAGAVESAIEVIARERPDVVLLDVHLPGGNGHGGADVIRGCAGIQSLAEVPVRFLALSVSDAAEDVIAVIRAGARGYVTKTISAPELLTAITRVADGDAVFSPRLAGFVLDAFGATAGEVAEIDEELDRLSAREREVMRLIARGYQYKEVAKELFISVKTVETHMSSVLRKLQLSSRHELTAWAMGRRLL